VKDFRGDLIRRFVLLDGFEVELNRLLRPPDELIEALRLGMASGEGGDRSYAASILVRPTRTLNSALISRLFCV